ncbi:lipocalin family protein [Psychroserpens algicola]|uniref:lipocalin family protein n=1 Tax=Psychroserpens algicola TaxID=1719034 RepID=UPI0019533471|nr:lipocalin family protein [Psychroserpens algicola]
MKTIKHLGLLILALLTINCSGDDDNNSDGELTVRELLISGKWYNESVTPGSYTDCEKMSYIQFSNNGTFTIENFEIIADNCESSGINTASFTLTNNTDITISFEGDTINAEIISITENLLTINSDNDETVVFDKIEG